ncbi:MAG: hypothetical protein ABS81_20170 [Pseudonocardia sp. SCN 72-86]|nr:MAG: hypothetical protein ABS81_20170 [Pseudonocardia sp. SCN 72-86]
MTDPGVVEGSSLVQAAYRAVRDAVVTRRLPPGSSTCATSTSSAQPSRPATSPRYAEVDRRFRAALWAASSNRRLFAIADLLGAQPQLGQAVTIAVPGRPEAGLVEHAEILDAVREGDTAAAENAVRRHVAQVLRALEAGLPVGLSTR